MFFEKIQYIGLKGQVRKEFWQINQRIHLDKESIIDTIECHRLTPKMDGPIL